MSRGWSYDTPNWYVTCDVCGKKMKASKARHRWDGFLVCDADFEHRHSQDFIRVRPDNLTVPFQRPKETPTFVDVTYSDLGATLCTPQAASGMADICEANCARAGIALNGYIF